MTLTLLHILFGILFDSEKVKSYFTISLLGALPPCDTVMVCPP